MTRRLDEFASNGHNRSWPVSDERGIARSVTLWTITLHEPTCRHAILNADGAPHQVHLFGANYFGEYLDLLRERGVNRVMASRDRIAWRGCKVCGTANIPRQEWRAMVDAQREEWRDAKRRDDDAYEAKRAVENARDARNRFIAEAEQAVYDAEFRVMVEARMSRVRERAREVWAESHPESAALLEADHA